MPNVASKAGSSIKRKRDSKDENDRSRENKKVIVLENDHIEVVKRISVLETEIEESPKHYNNVASLLQLARDVTTAPSDRAAAAVSLCRVFCRFIAEGKLVKPKNASENESIIVAWLKERYEEYKSFLMDAILNPIFTDRKKAITLVMHLLSEEAHDERRPSESVWLTGLFRDLISILLEISDDGILCEDFAIRYAQEFADVRYYTFKLISETLAEERSAKSQAVIVSNCLSILSGLQFIESDKGSSPALFGGGWDKASRRSKLASVQRRCAQNAWLTLLHTGLNKEQRKAVLSIMTYRIVPWFQQVERLMDFLTDSYNIGGATSLLALSGLFFLMQEKNLDYPAFYMRLYSLLDADILHSKHRSRFFRLLNTFMSSTHLPAAMVASFVKKLSRLALHGPPAGIVAVVPWVYNMLQSHPACSFMVHREPRTAKEKKRLEDYGADDPFDNEEKDPMMTNAIESSLWELESLQSHYHPNVASLAKIISEQYTKSSYNLEDFLDLSYNNLIEAELGKDMKTTPVVEFQIPKKIFTEENMDEGPLKDLMLKILG